MTISGKRHASGLTLIEVMVAMAVIIVGIIGAMGFRYYSILDARKADVQIGASRLSSMLLEGWKSAAGYSAADTEPYDPVAMFGTQLPIVMQDVGPEVASGFEKHAKYTIKANREEYFATLSYKDDGNNRTLNVATTWGSKFRTDSSINNRQVVKLTTYIVKP